MDFSLWQSRPAHRVHQVLSFIRGRLHDRDRAFPRVRVEQANGVQIHQNDAITKPGRLPWSIHYNSIVIQAVRRNILSVRPCHRQPFDPNLPEHFFIQQFREPFTMKMRLHIEQTPFPVAEIHLQHVIGKRLYCNNFFASSSFFPIPSPQGIIGLYSSCFPIRLCSKFFFC